MKADKTVQFQSITHTHTEERIQYTAAYKQIENLGTINAKVLK